MFQISHFKPRAGNLTSIVAFEVNSVIVAFGQVIAEERKAASPHECIAKLRGNEIREGRLQRPHTHTTNMILALLPTHSCYPFQCHLQIRNNSGTEMLHEPLCSIR